jgi:hypothetical protein
MKDIVSFFCFFYAFIEVSSYVDFKLVGVIVADQEEGNKNNAKQSTNVRKHLIQFLKTPIIGYRCRRLLQVINGINIAYFCVGTF